MNILVIGSGVIGLSTAVTLLENGHKVTIVTKSMRTEICSPVAGKIDGNF